MPHHPNAGQIDGFSTATEKLQGLRQHQISSVELLDLHLGRIECYNPGLNSIVTPNYEDARRAAAALISEGEATGFHFLTRLRDDWLSGENRFDQPGEAFLVAEIDGQLAGVCGLNRNPYDPDSRIGRVRRLYVARAYRRQGVATQLVLSVIRAAAGHFDELELRTKTEEASGFYQSLGFLPVDRANATHVLKLGASQPGGE